MSSKWPPGELEFVSIHQAWQDYQSWYQARSLRPPLPALSGCFVALLGKPVCGCLYYPTAGPYLFVEHAATNPRAPLRLRHRAFRRMLEGIRESALAARQQPICLVKPTPGMSRLLMQAGFRCSPTVQWYLP